MLYDIHARRAEVYGFQLVQPTQTKDIVRDWQATMVVYWQAVLKEGLLILMQANFMQ